MRSFMQIVENALRSSKAADIDIDDAMRHFDMPVDMSRRDMRAAFAATKKQFIQMFKGQRTITVYRGLTVPHDWQPEDGLGRSWAFAVDGAMKGSGLRYWRRNNDEMGVIMVGEVSIDDVDWLTTIAVNAFHEDEMEIVIREGAPVLVKQVVEADKDGFQDEYGVLLTPNRTFAA